jgi:hypothetical protein
VLHLTLEVGAVEEEADGKVNETLFHLCSFLNLFLGADVPFY